MVKVCLTLKETENYFPEWLWHFPLPPLKINQWKPLAKWSREVRRGSSHTLPLKVKCIINRRKLILYYPVGKGKNFSLPGYSPTNEKTVTIQPMKKPLHFSVAFQCPVYSHKLILTASLNSPFLSMKECFLYFCSLDLPVVCNRFMHLTL